MDYNPYHHVVGPGGWSNYETHSVTPLDSVSQIAFSVPHSGRSGRRSNNGPRGVITEYNHAVTPLDSASQLTSTSSPSNLTTPSSNTAGYEEDNIPSPYSQQPMSPLSHEDFHSHISLSFYSRNDFFDRISSLVHTEPRPRAYYNFADPLPETSQVDHSVPMQRSVSTEDSDNAGLESSGSNWSLNHLNPLPYYHTPLSVTYPPPQPPVVPSSDAYWDWAYGGYAQSPYVSLASSTEYDDVDDVTYVSHDPQVPRPFPPFTVPVVEGGVASAPGPSSAVVTELEGDEGVSCDSHMTTPVPAPQFPFVPPEEEGVEGPLLYSDSVLLSRTYPSFPPPSFPSHTPTPLPPSHTPSTLTPLPPSSPHPLGDPQGYQPSVSSSSDSGPGGHTHRREFEVGEVHTSGRDSFQNIQAHIDAILNGHKGVSTPAGAVVVGRTVEQTATQQEAAVDPKGEADHQ